MSVLTKRKRGRPRLDESREISDFDASLIANVKKFPIFYDKNHPHYRNRESTEHVWDLVAKSLSVPVNIVKNRMFQLRNRYNVEKRRSSTTWPLFESLQYISEYCKRRSNRSNPATVNMSANAGPEISSTDAEDEDEQDDQDVEEEQQRNFENGTNEENGFITSDRIDFQQHSHFLNNSQPATEESNIAMPEDNSSDNRQNMKKFTAFGDFLASSLIELNEIQALHLVRQFTTDLVEYSILGKGSEVSRTNRQRTISSGEQEDDDNVQHK